MRLGVCKRTITLARSCCCASLFACSRAACCCCSLWRRNSCNFFSGLCRCCSAAASIAPNTLNMWRRLSAKGTVLQLWTSLYDPFARNLSGPSRQLTHPELPGDRPVELVWLKLGDSKFNVLSLVLRAVDVLIFICEFLLTTLLGASGEGQVPLSRGFVWDSLHTS